jgi:ABC-2 type transport system ATP-binding protein
MIQAEGLTRRYGAFTAVDDVSFHIERGEIVGLLGHNGAGKSTIMKMLTGYLEPTLGRVVIDGCDLRLDRQRAQRKIGYLPETCPVYPEMAVVDYLDYTAALHGVPEPRRMARIRDAIERTELGPKATALISTLSRGYMQRVGVAQAILHEPGILVLDEPTNGLDPTQIHHMRDLIRTLARSATVILSTHILQEVEAVCDRVIIMRSGKKVLDQPLDALREGRRVLIALDGEPRQVAPALAEMASVEKVEELHAESEKRHYVYAITLASGADTARAASELAHRAVRAGFALYSLQPERKDLEAIFGSIAAGEGVSGHA